ncbi:mycothiol synthase, partial [Streptomyces albidoflavus]
MTSDAAAPVPSRQIHTTDELTEDQAATVLTLLADAAAEDGQQAVSEQGRLQLRGGRREGVRHLLRTADGPRARDAPRDGRAPPAPPPP